MARDELLSPEVEPEEAAVEVGLRPRRLAEFIGQAELKGHLRVMLEAARQRGQAADHFLFAGPPGLGKTTLAHIVAVEMGAELHVTSGPALERSTWAKSRTWRRSRLPIRGVPRLRRAISEAPSSSRSTSRMPAARRTMVRRSSGS